MAKLLISCDDYLFRHEGRYFFKTEEWRDFYYRYLRVFEEIRICNRVIDEPELKKGRVLVDDIRIEVCPLPIFHGPKEYITKYFSTGKAMRKAVDGCDAALLRLPSTVAQRLSKRVRRKHIPYATEIVFDANDGANTANKYYEKILWRIIDRQMRRTCASADGVSCVTAKHLQKRYFSIKPGHFVSNYSTLALDKSFFSGPRQFPDGKTMTIAHLSLQIGLYDRKGTKEVLDAVSLLKKEGLTVNIQYAGDDWDNSKQILMKYAEKHGIGGQVSCPGLLSRTEVSEFLDKADLYVVPTKAEGLPRVVIEAMAKGMPVVTSPASGTPELISGHFLVGYSDVRAIADRIKELVTDKALYEEVSAINYKNSLEYEASILQKRRDAFYQKLKALTNK